jgi:transposase
MTTRRYNADVSQDADKRYASDLSDQEFDILAPLVAQKEGSGKQRTVNFREILNAIF